MIELFIPLGPLGCGVYLVELLGVCGGGVECGMEVVEEEGDEVQGLATEQLHLVEQRRQARPQRVHCTGRREAGGRGRS